MSIWSRIFRRVYPSLSWETPLNYVKADITALPAVQRCLTLIAGDVARCPVTVTDGAGNRVSDVTIETLLSVQAWEMLTGAEFRRWMVSEALTTGNAFARIDIDNQGQPVALVPLATGDMSFTQDPDGTIAWTYKGVRVDYQFLLHWRALPTPGNPYWGTSPLAAASTTLEGLAYLETAFNAYAKAGGIPKLGFSHPGALRPDVRNDMRTVFMSQHGSASAAATPVFVGEGMKIEPLVPSMASDLATLRANGIREVASLFGVPAAYLDASDARTQPEIAQQYVSSCLEAWSVSWMAETTSKLARPGVRVAIDFSPVTQGDFRTAGRAYSQLVQVGCLAPNDVRKRLGFPPVEGMDVPQPVISGVTPDPTVQDGQGDPNA